MYIYRYIHIYVCVCANKYTSGFTLGPLPFLTDCLSWRALWYVALLQWLTFVRLNNHWTTRTVSQMKCWFTLSCFLRYFVTTTEIWLTHTLLSFWESFLLFLVCWMFFVMKVYCLLFNAFSVSIKMTMWFSRSFY